MKQKLLINFLVNICDSWKNKVKITYFKMKIVFLNNQKKTTTTTTTITIITIVIIWNKYYTNIE